MTALLRPYLAQTRAELVMTARQGEQVLVALGIPLLLLIFLSSVDVLPQSSDEPIDFLAPAIGALAVMSTALVSLSIATAFDRQYGVLERLGTTPLGRFRLLLAKATMVLIVEIIQLVVLWLVASVFLGWSPAFRIGPLAGAVALGTLAFAGLAMLIAGTVRGTTTLAVANGLYVVLLLFGGVIVAADELPGVLANVAPYLPSGALVDLMIDVTGGTTAGQRPWIVLAAWAVGGVIVAVRFFSWEE